MHQDDGFPFDRMAHDSDLEIVHAIELSCFQLEDYMSSVNRLTY